MPIDESRGRWFEELEVGAVYQHRPRRTIGEGDNVLFTTLTMNPQSLHLDETYAQTTEFGTRIVNSLLTMSTIVGLSVGDLTERTLVANLGFTDVVFPHPVFHGDTIAASTVVHAKRLSNSRPQQGVVEFEHVGHNQRGDVVCRIRRNALMHCAPAGETLSTS